MAEIGSPYLGKFGSKQNAKKAIYICATITALLWITSTLFLYLFEQKFLIPGRPERQNISLLQISFLLLWPFVLPALLASSLSKFYATIILIMSIIVSLGTLINLLSAIINGRTFECIGSIVVLLITIGQLWMAHRARYAAGLLKEVAARQDVSVF